MVPECVYLIDPIACRESCPGPTLIVAAEMPLDPSSCTVTVQFALALMTSVPYLRPRLFAAFAMAFARAFTMPPAPRASRLSIDWSITNRRTYDDMRSSAAVLSSVIVAAVDGVEVAGSAASRT